MKSVVIIEGSTLYFLIFLRFEKYGCFFSLNHSLSQGESFLKISGHQVQSFWRSYREQTDSLTDILLLQKKDLYKATPYHPFSLINTITAIQLDTSETVEPIDLKFSGRIPLSAQMVLDQTNLYDFLQRINMLPI